MSLHLTRHGHSHPKADAGFAERRFAAPDGLMLSARVYGPLEADRPFVVCLAGLTRNARDFHQLALFLSHDDAVTPSTVVCLDYRGRGRSEYDRDWRNYDIVVEAGDVLAALDALGIARAAFIGASRGGLIIHVLAAMRPAAMEAIVFNDVGPVVEGAGLAQIRAFLENAPKPATFADAVRVLKTAHGTAFPALGDADWQRMAHAIYRDEGGRPVPDYDPKLLKTVRGIDFDKPLPVLWPQFMGLTAIPLLAIRGGNSTLLSAETLKEMARRHPHMEAVTVEGQGHTPLLETAGLPERIDTFFTRVRDLH